MTLTETIAKHSVNGCFRINHASICDFPLFNTHETMMEQRVFMLANGYTSHIDPTSPPGCTFTYYKRTTNN
jgi:hypothetical protein